jgi:hypothetical protein
MIDKDGFTPITRAKDEITANLREGTKIETIEKYLTEPEDK